MTGLILRIGYAMAIYEPSLVIYHGGDYELYRQGAEDILRGDLAFTNDLYLLRPPLFPLLIALLRLQPAGYSRRQYLAQQHWSFHLHIYPGASAPACHNSLPLLAALTRRA